GLRDGIPLGFACRFDCIPPPIVPPRCSPAFILPMPEATAQKKFSCPACGAAAEWNPAKQSLVCPFCGTTSPAQMELNAAGEQVVTEHDLVAAIRGIPDDKRGWQAKKTSV